MQVDSRYSWTRLIISLAISTIGGIGLWAHVIVLPAIQAEFGIDRSTASLPYTATLIGFAIGGVLIGRFVDKHGIFRPLLVSSILLGAGFILAGLSLNYWVFITVQAVMIGMLGSSAMFGPMVADISHWFVRHRGMAVSIVASGNYLAGAIWPPFMQAMIQSIGWRQTYMVIGVICLVTLLPLVFLLRKRADLDAQPVTQGVHAYTPTAMSPNALTALLVLAGIACCVAMSMPQVHTVAYCADLGYGPARGAQMLSLMLGFGVISRLISGFIADRIGGVKTLILGSTLQCIALIFYLPFDGLVSLYVISAMFGLAQGGIVPSYAMIVRQYFPANEAGARVSLVLMATVVGMALGGWMSGEIYDLTGSYQAAFINGIGWNLLNMAIALWLLTGKRFGGGRRKGAPRSDGHKAIVDAPG